jgi:sterol desaturase/sphingolipid hydroxylase (fatty acid hydroxylase superfamily)
VSTIRGRGRSPARNVSPVAYGLFVVFGVYFALIAAVAVWLALAPHDRIYHLFGRALGPADIAHRLIRRGVVLGLLLPVLLVIELALEGWEESSLRQLLVQRSRSAWSDIAIFLFWQAPGHTGVGAALSLGLTLLPAAWLHRTLANATGLSIELGSWPVALQVIAFYFVYSLFDYWEHRLDHTARFWPLHRYHHAAEDFCVLTSVRVHPASISGVISGVIPAVLIGMSEGGLFWFVALNLTVHYLIHTRIASDFGWIGRWVIQSPLHHRLHHKLDMTEPTSNFALVPLWDRLFGTWAEAAVPRVAVGVAAPYRHGVWAVPDLLRDYRHFWLALAGRYRDEARPESPPEA